MKLSREQSQRLLRDRSIWLTKACDKCGRLLGSVRWTRKDEPGEWCSAECRDGIKVALKARTRCCRECGVVLEWKRTDSEFCAPAHRMRFNRKSRTGQKREISANMLIEKQGLTKAQNGKSTDTLSPRPEGARNGCLRQFHFRRGGGNLMANGDSTQLSDRSVLLEISRSIRVFPGDRNCRAPI